VKIAESTKTRRPDPRLTPPTVPSSAERIRDAALALFSRNGVSATPMRAVAEAAGISIGLVQHYYRTKAALVDAVNDRVLRVISDALESEPIPEPPEDPTFELGRRITTAMADEPEVVDYLGHALVEGDAIGSVIFDGLFAISEARRDFFVEREQTRPDLDMTWSAMLPVTLRLAAIILRSHVERHLPEPFTTPSQLRRWDEAVINLLREGQLRS
jgi:TetR/AcrR family transcriptional regulator, regulator of cefoperazone and chloramphenicol sensitivity